VPIAIAVTKAVADKGSWGPVASAVSRRGVVVIPATVQVVGAVGLRWNIVAVGWCWTVGRLGVATMLLNFGILEFWN